MRQEGRKRTEPLCLEGDRVRAVPAVLSVELLALGIVGPPG